MIYSKGLVVVRCQGLGLGGVGSMPGPPPSTITRERRPGTGSWKF